MEVDMPRCPKFLAGLLSAGLLAISSWALPGAAQAFPQDKPIEIIVPYTTGSMMDRYARGSAPVVSEILGVPVVVHNVPGATGWNRVFRSSPDGHTLGVGEPVSQLGLQLVQELPYKPIGEDGLTWLGRFSTGNQLLALSARSQFTSLDDMRDSPDPVRCGTFGGLSAGAMQCALLANHLNFEVAFVNLAGPPELALATVRGDVDIGSIGTVLWLDHIETGDVIPLLVWSDEPDERAPDVPTLQSVGLEDLAVLTVTRGLFAPPGMPEDVKSRILAAYEEAMTQAPYLEFLDTGRLDRNHLFSEDYPRALDAVNQALEENVDLFTALY
jgi:tripartite-type tricarboxylate transporter receptor subunit TctC